MEKKVIEFKKGDIIVSGYGNIGIFNGIVNGNMGERLTAYCSSRNAPAGTDMRYARHATEEEKKIFFNALEKNGYTWNPDSFTVDANEDCPLTTNYDTGRVDWKADGMHPFKVVGEKKKRIRPTWTQVHELEQTIKEQQELIEKMKAMVESQSSALEKARLRVRDIYGENIALTAENNRLRNRGFLDRILNK